jgi:hypothetical protein
MDETIPTSDSSGRSKPRRSTQDRTVTSSSQALEMPAKTTSSAGASTGQESSAQLTREPANGAGNGEDGFVGRVRERANAQITTQKDRATDGLGTIAQAVRRSTQELRGGSHDTLAEYVEQAADQLERLSTHLKSKDVGELLHDAQRLARRRPVVFIGSAFALGLIGARFLKSSRPRTSPPRPALQRPGAQGPSAGVAPPDYVIPATAHQHAAPAERL